MKIKSIRGLVRLLVALGGKECDVRGCEEKGRTQHIGKFAIRLCPLHDKQLKGGEIDFDDIWWQKYLTI